MDNLVSSEKIRNNTRAKSTTYEFGKAKTNRFITQKNEEYQFEVSLIKSFSNFKSKCNQSLIITKQNSENKWYA